MQFQICSHSTACVSSLSDAIACWIYPKTLGIRWHRVQGSNLHPKAFIVPYYRPSFTTGSPGPPAVVTYDLRTGRGFCMLNTEYYATAISFQRRSLSDFWPIACGFERPAWAVPVSIQRHRDHPRAIPSECAANPHLVEENRGGKGIQKFKPVTLGMTPGALNKNPRTTGQ